MDKQKIMDTRRDKSRREMRLRLANMGVYLVLAVLTLFFLKWLYQPMPATVFREDTQTDREYKKYADNPYIQLINQVIPAAKTGYELNYGKAMPGPVTYAVSRSLGEMPSELNSPITFMNIVYTAFGMESSRTAATAAADGKEGQLPDIKNFDDAPQGAIYFNEEDENTGGAGTQPSVTPAADNGDVNEDELSPPEKLALAKKAPQILIYHTHATESYMPNVAGNYHTLNEKLSVISVGNTMTKTLQSKYKYKVIHDKTLHDKDSYVYSYGNSLETIKKTVQANKTVKVILDVHRDAFSVSSKERNAKKGDYTAVINGKKAAKVMLVIGGKNPNYPELERFAVYIKKKMEKLYPGLFLKIERKSRSKYNQYYSDYSMLIEVGCMLNTDEEARYSGELVGNVIGEVLKDLKE